jgi:hypothetical protein
MNLTIVFEFCYLCILIMILACALSCRSGVDALVAVRFLSDLSL